MTQHQGQRRIDRVAAEKYLKELASQPVEVIRSMRDECREEEVRLSYTRRMLQGRLDITRAEEARRGGHGEGGDLVKELATILSDGPKAGRRSAAVRPLYEPPTGSRRSLDGLTSDATLGRLPDMSDHELSEFAGQLAREERSVSDLRRRVLDHLDSLQAELIRRYRAGQVAVDDIVATMVPENASGDS